MAGQINVEAYPEFGVTVISQWIFNCYVVHDGGEGRPFVVDAGVPSTAPAVVNELRRLGFSPADLACVVATHGHADHVGGMSGLAQAGAPAGSLALPGKIRDYLAGETPRSPGPREVAHILPVMGDQPFSFEALRELSATTKVDGYDARSGARFAFTPEHWLGEGDGIPGAPDWMVLHTPGHSDDSISFACRTKPILISGDAVLAVGRRAWFNPEYVDRVLSQSTENRLRSLHVELLLPGHGRPVASHTLWDEALAHTDRPRGQRATLVRQLFRSHRHGA